MGIFAIDKVSSLGVILSTFFEKEVQPFPPAMAVRERQGCGVVKAALVVNASCL